MATTRNATAAADDDLRHHETETPTASNSSSSWRKLSCRTLSRSRQIMSIVDDIEDDDEEALKWAAIERLPTYDRVRKSILVGLEGKGEEIDVKDLGYEEKRILIERLVNDVVVDNEKLLLKLRDRMERVGIEIPTVEVRFEGINVEAEVKVRDGALSIFNSYFINNIATVGFTKHANKVPIASDHDTKQLRILQDVSGCIKPGRLTLLLGPPSSGKTTLLLALAGRLDGKLKVSGKVTYNGHVMEEFVPQRTAAYIGEHDVHIPTMTVRETLEFSARCQGVGCRYEALAELSRREKAAKIVPDPDIDVFMKSLAMEGKESIETDYILKILGLDICADTFVGNQMVRGISGGQRKRATSGELLVGPAMVLFMDQISNGLDSSTTFQIVNSLRHFAHILKGTAVLSLLQPAPDTYHLFDDIILLSDGQIVYQGPREHVLDFFDHMGFKCPERYGVANFLQEVTSRKDQQQYWARKDEHYRFITAREFAEAFQSFHIGCANLKELSIPFDRSRNHPAALTTKKYGAGKKELFKACLSREYLLMKRNSSLYITEIAKLLITAILTMTVFLRTNMHKDSTRDGTIYMGALFFTISRMLFSEIPELSLTVLRLPVFYKHRDLHFFPTWAIALSHWILKIPITIPIVGLWMFPTYYGIGYDPSITRFLKQYLLLFLVCQMASGLHRFVGAACRDMGLACTYAFNGITLLFVLGGFVLSRENVKSWWVWGYWISPLMYAQNGIAVNEFLGKSWSHALPNGTEPIGVTVLKSKGLFPNASWYWLSIGALIGFTILFNILYALALSFLHPFRKSRAVMIADTQFHVNEKHSNGAELHHRGMILPFDRHFITFSDMAYSIDMPKEMRKRGVEEDRLELVKGVSGAFRPGVLTALMGVSGAGKTTLLDVLAGRKTGGYIEGDIKVSGWPKKQETFARIAGYCEQNDIHSPHVTVYESMIYSAWLRLSPEVDASTRKIFVNEVMELLELTPLSGMLVGLPGVSGLSIEQRKRLTIAVELVANPSIIFMDEPTSGLDARAAAIVMRTVRNTVDTGRTVVCTIHQPSIEIFEDFDELLLLKRGGKEIYVGPLGEHSCHLIEYFEGVEGVSKIKDGVNPADWMLDVTAPAQELALGVDFAEIYRNSDQFRRTNAVIQELNMPQDGSIQLSFPTKYSQPFFTQLVACLWKQHWSYWHNSSYNRRRLITAVIMATVLGSIFWDLGTNLTSKQDLFNSMGSVYIAAVFFALQNCSAVQPEVTVERTVLYRERGGGMYSVAAYALAQLMIEIPYVMVQTLLYGVIVYAMMGFEWAAAKFFWFMFFMFFTFLYCTYFGMMTVAISPDGSICIVVSSFFYGLWNLFSGFVIPRPMIPIWWRWQYWTNPIAWSLYGLLASQYGDVNDVLLDAGMTVQQFVGQFYGVRRDFLGAISGGVVGYSLLFAFMFAFFVTVFDFQKR